MTINWYPGHMAKAKKEIIAQLKLIDVIIEVLDARIPYSSRNPDIKDMIGNRHHIIVLNKADLSDSEVTDMWVNAFKKEYDIKSLPVNAIKGTGINKLVNLLGEIKDEISEKRKAKGMLPRPARAIVVGIPNVGKSKLINSIAGVNKVRVENKPGVTRSLSWIRVGTGVEIMDTPGLLWPKQNDIEVSINLALTGTIKQNLINEYELCIHLIEKLQKIRPDVFDERYGIGKLSDAEAIFNSVAEKRRCLLKGGGTDYERASRLILSDFKTGKLGRYSLEKPE